MSLANSWSEAQPPLLQTTAQLVGQNRMPTSSPKMGIVEEEADESAFWMEVISETGLMKKELVEDLLDEANQIVAIVVSSINTARGHKR